MERYVPQGRVRIPRRILEAGLCLLALAAALPASDEATRVYKLLVEPGDSAAPGIFAQSADLVATLDRHSCKVKSADPLRPGQGQSLIVLDFGRTEPAVHPCLLAEALSAARRVGEKPRPVHVAAGPSRYYTRIDLGRGLELLAYLGGEVDKLAADCESGRARVGSKDSPQPGASALGTVRLLRGLDYTFASRDEPVRVFYLAEKFEAFVSWQGSGNSAGLADSELAVWPIVFGRPEPGRGLRPPTHAQLKDALALAASTGGAVYAVSGGRGDTLVHAFESSRAGVVLTAECPFDANAWNPVRAVTVQVSAGAGKQAPHWQRRCAANGPESLKWAPPGTVQALTPLVVPSSRLGLHWGCPDPGNAASRSLQLTVPPEVVSAPPGQMEVYLDFPEEPGLVKQRTTLDRRRDPGAGLCLPLSSGRDGALFRLLVVDRVTGWVGAAGGKLGPHETN